jgi:glycosyltransferase involved in cell wall biosynthesis
MNIKNLKIGVIIPSYKVSNHIVEVVNNIPDFIDTIIVVDDKCPEQSGMLIQKNVLEKNIQKTIFIEYHEKNKGVGGAMITGYKKGIELGLDILIKMDGDNQMDPKYLHNLIEPILNNKADYTKGNRFKDLCAIRKMPKIRLFGNSGLSFLVKIASGYWNMMDPTNGYTAINLESLTKLDLEKIDHRYFFETDMLINLNIQEAVVLDIPIPAKYEDETSSLNITKIIFEFPPKILKGLIKRIFFKYFLYNFNMLSMYLTIGLPMLVFGIIFGSIEWIESIQTGVEATTGTVMLSVLPIVLGTQFLLQAIQIDMDNIPKK